MKTPVSDLKRQEDQEKNVINCSNQDLNLAPCRKSALLEPNELCLAGMKMTGQSLARFTAGPLPRNKLEFTAVLEHVSSNPNNGNSTPDGNGKSKQG
ncbi:hypothetical protein K2173_014286 [Erythroxylum novogranatense]|uniref:Uncharacterized protein n=1 Tax=Erythroxylum novogranatense TaxID=1862640 RepID=A0AAV8SDR8_9ROSI|nr:hypothetical protein K2173_014286 [Erythroxylum novogranatense]